MIADEQIQHWHELAAKATPGRWLFSRAIDNPGETRIEADTGDLLRKEVARLGFFDHPEVQADATFIVAAREAVPALLEENAQLRAEIAALLSAKAKEDARQQKEAVWEQFAEDCMPAYLDYASETMASRLDFNEWLLLKAEECGISPPWQEWQREA